MRRVKLEDVADKIDYGLTASASQKKIGPKFLRITDIQNNHVDWNSVPYCKCTDQEFNKKKLFEGDIVFARTGATTGKSILIKDVDQAVVFASYLIRISLTKSKVLPEYVAYFFRSSIYWNQIYGDSDGATLPSFNATKLKNIKIPLPSLDEQKAIVAKLDRAQRLIDIDREMLAKYDELIQSIFLDMFGDPVLNKVEDSNVVELSELVKIVGGGTPSKKKPEYWNGSIPWVSPKDMKLNLIFESKDKITEDAINQSSAKLINRGAVLAVVRSGILKKRWPLAINKIDVALNQDMKAFICKKSINNYFLLYYLKLYSRKILNSVRGTTADNISSTAIKKIPVRVPELVKQEKFMRMVQCIESEKQGIDVSIREKLFTSLLHKKLQVYDRAMQN